MKQTKFPKKLIVFSVIAIVCTSLFAGLSWLLFAPTPPSYKLHAPTNLRIIELANGQKEVCVDKCSQEDTAYTFIIQPAGGKGIIAKTFNNKLNLSSYLNQPISYTIFCQYTSLKSDGYNSNYVHIPYTNTITLNAPTIHIGISDEKNRLYFSSNNLFDVTVNLRFELVYVSGTETITFSEYHQTTNNNHGVVTGFFNLEDTIIQKGTYALFVRVKCINNTNIHPSNLSSAINYTLE